MGKIMAFQVRVRVNKNEIKVLSVASSSEEFEQFTIGGLKERALSFFPSVNGRFKFVYIRLNIDTGILEDSQTFESCNIEHLSVLIIVLQVPGGRGTV
uniref:Uncharacterized protein n=1 Tax=Cyprinus carpio TaxID=7962 RepID=A0A8C1DMS7_CYPCA